MFYDQLRRTDLIDWIGLNVVCYVCSQKIYLGGWNLINFENFLWGCQREGDGNAWNSLRHKGQVKCSQYKRFLTR